MSNFGPWAEQELSDQERQTEWDDQFCELVIDFRASEVDPLYEPMISDDLFDLRPEGCQEYLRELGYHD